MFNLDLKEIMEKAQDLQAKVMDLKEKLAEKVVQGSAGGGMVEVEANGAQEILSIKIESDLLTDPDPEMLQELLVAAINDALRRSRELATDEMAKITGGLRIPGMM